MCSCFGSSCRALFPSHSAEVTPGTFFVSKSKGQLISSEMLHSFCTRLYSVCTRSVFCTPLVSVCAHWCSVANRLYRPRYRFSQVAVFNLYSFVFRLCSFVLRLYSFVPSVMAFPSRFCTPLELVCAPLELVQTV